MKMNFYLPKPMTATSVTRKAINIICILEYKPMNDTINRLCMCVLRWIITASDVLMFLCSHVFLCQLFALVSKK